MIEKTEDEISAECLRVLGEHDATRIIRRVPIIATGRNGEASNWTYGIIEPRLDPATARIAQNLIMSVAEKWPLIE